MPQDAAADPERDDVATVLSDVTFDLMPTGEFEAALAPLPDGARTAVVLTPRLGIGPTLERTELAIERGYEVVPHVAARFVADRDELDDIAGRLTDAGVTELFVPGGDRDEPIGAFSSAYEMLVALEELGYSFEEVGIAGYPTGHESIDDATLRVAMERKAPHATYLLTQLCFDAAAILEWIEEIRDRGISLPVEPGVPGVVDYRRLMALARKWGVVGPIQFVRKTTGVASFVREMVGSGGRYRPDDMVGALATRRNDPLYDIRRLRLYTFNRTRDTESWRRERIDRP
jgi:methylenetetrahydrofolate reductase (NADPH)